MAGVRIIGTADIRRRQKNRRMKKEEKSHTKAEARVRQRDNPSSSRARRLADRREARSALAEGEKELQEALVDEVEVLGVAELS